MKHLLHAFVLPAALLGGLAGAETAPLRKWFAASMRGDAADLQAEPIAPGEIAGTRKKVLDAYREAALENGWDKKFISPNTGERDKNGGRTKVTYRHSIT